MLTNEQDIKTLNVEMNERSYDDKLTIIINPLTYRKCKSKPYMLVLLVFIFIRLVSISFLRKLLATHWGFRPKIEKLFKKNIS